MLTLLAIVGTMLFVTFFGKQFGEALGGIGEGISGLLSPQIRPTLAPTIGLEFTPGIWDWWTAAKPWLTWVKPPANGAGGDTDTGGDNGGNGNGWTPGQLPTGAIRFWDRPLLDPSTWAFKRTEVNHDLDMRAY